MTIDHPETQTVPALRQLWKDTFGDSDAFLDAFFTTAYSPDRCLCVTREGELLAAVYWLDGAAYGEKLAYLYALAVRSDHRGKGIGSRLMEHTHALLEERGYRGVLLVPQEDRLVSLYSRLGYRNGTMLGEFSCTAGIASIYTPMKRVSGREYAQLRRRFLPKGAVLQEGESMAFLQTQAELYAGENWLLAVRREKDSLTGLELLGDVDCAPRILRAFRRRRGTFRTPGGDRPFTMFRPLTDTPAQPPTYFAFAFD